VKLEHLKKIRRAVSLLLFIPLAVIFLDFANLVPLGWIKSVLYLQFIPSLLQFATLANVAALGFLVTVLLTFLFGRVYCSSICPLGTLQDIIARLARRKYSRPQKSFNKLRYGILVATLVSALGGSLFLLNILDPYSNFGRIMTNLVKPMIVGANNGVAFGLQALGVYSLHAVEMKGVEPSSLVFSIVVLVVLWIMAYRHERLFCNTICPLGAFLGLLSKFSLYKIAINEQTCLGCTSCERVCKGGCIDRQAKTVDFTRCVGCYNCFHDCPTQGIVFVRSGKPSSVKSADATAEGAIAPRTARSEKHPAKTEQKTDLARRDIVIKALLFFTGTAQVAKKRIISTKESTVAVVRTIPVVPPGAISIEHFTGRCTACHLCVSACPSQVLAPSFLEYGITGIMQPRMKYTQGFCSFECTRCTEICPSGAILPLSNESKKLSQLGTAKFVKDNCIVSAENKECGACSEHCPTKAVNMVPYKGSLVIPEVKEEFCIGCGACEFACPTLPYKAIYVEGKAVHGIAKKREVKKIEEAVEEDFPF
jgi:ferredoxin